MERKIFDLYSSAVERVEEALGERVFDRKYPSEFSYCWDVILCHNVIVKLYDDMMVLDLAGNKEFISFDDFSKMEII